MLELKAQREALRSWRLERSGLFLCSPPQSGKRCRPAGEAEGFAARCVTQLSLWERSRKRQDTIFSLSVIARLGKDGCGSDLEKTRNVWMPPCLVSSQLFKQW